MITPVLIWLNFAGAVVSCFSDHWDKATFFTTQAIFFLVLDLKEGHK